MRVIVVRFQLRSLVWMQPIDGLIDVQMSLIQSLVSSPRCLPAVNSNSNPKKKKPNQTKKRKSIARFYRLMSRVVVVGETSQTKSFFLLSFFLQTRINIYARTLPPLSVAHARRIPPPFLFCWLILFHLILFHFSWPISRLSNHPKRSNTTWISI